MDLPEGHKPLHIILNICWGWGINIYFFINFILPTQEQKMHHMDVIFFFCSTWKERKITASRETENKFLETV